MISPTFFRQLLSIELDGRVCLEVGLSGHGCGLFSRTLKPGIRGGRGREGDEYLGGVSLNIENGHKEDLPAVSGCL